jgi:hypothetical protein
MAALSATVKWDAFLHPVSLPELHGSLATIRTRSHRSSSIP